MTWEGSVQKLSHVCYMELQEQLLLCTTVVPASRLVTWQWWGSRAFSREKKKSEMDCSTCGTQVSLPTPPAPLFTPIPGAAQLW